MAFEIEGAICCDCLGDAELAAIAREQGSRRKCQVCGQRRKGVALSWVASEVDHVFREYFEPGRQWGDSAQEGEYPEDIIADLLGCEPELAEFLRDHLAAEEAYDVVTDGGIPMYEESWKYRPIETGPWYELGVWREFEDYIKYERRFLSADGFANLHELLGDLSDIADRFGLQDKLRLDPANPETPVIYRARLGGYPGAAKELVDGAPRSLGAPPPDRNIGGRMHPAGVPAFYGSFSRETCVRELRPNVGEHVVSAGFRVARPIELLNLPAFSELDPHISYFAPQYWRTASQLLFLRSFHRIISRPVFPSREALDYLPTQAVAEFLRVQMNVDGIVFMPAQGRDWPAGPSQREFNNVVLFCAPFLHADELAHRTHGRPPGAAGKFFDILGEPPDPPLVPSLQMVADSIMAEEVVSVDVTTVQRLPFELESEALVPEEES